MEKAFDKDLLLSMITKLREQAAASSLVSGPESQPKCKKCNDEEGVFIKVPYETYINGEKVTYMIDAWKDCECRDKNKIERSFKSSKITLEFQKKNFDTFSLEDRPDIVRFAYKFSRTYASNFDQIKQERANSICMLGRPGCGKTHLLMAISNHLISRGVTVLYFPWVEGFNEIKDDLNLTEERINKMQKVDVLFIDDMFKARDKPTPFQLEQMFAVINYRYMEKKPILVSSERDIDQMCDIDEALGSRINEMCKDFRIVLKGGSELNYRLKEEAL